MLQNSTESGRTQAGRSPAGVARRGGRRSAGAGAAVGLSTAHISPQASIRVGETTFYVGGCLIEARKSTITGLAQVGGGPRRWVSGFSRQSHRRLQKRLGMIDRSCIPIFVTLTYPGVWPPAPATWKRQFDNFDKRMARRFPGSALVWKMEPQRRGAPHFHLLVWGVKYQDLRAWVPIAWYEVVGSGDERHLHAGTQVQRVHTWRGVQSYAAKYMGKPIEGTAWEYPGRWWGLRRPESVPWAQVMTVQATDSDVCKLMRLMRRYAHMKGYDCKSLSILVNDAAFWFERRDRLLPSSPPQSE